MTLYIGVNCIRCIYSCPDSSHVVRSKCVLVVSGTSTALAEGQEYCRNKAAIGQPRCRYLSEPEVHKQIQESHTRIEFTSDAINSLVVGGDRAISCARYPYKSADELMDDG